MFLKTLSLAGFKSFADRTRLDFESGINVIVGPNGSGKSNLLDALAWVMGTQATRALRTERMEDVIFAGTTTRPALGRAEVAVTFDNSDGFLPIELSEVRMTRRLYRDGTSEYELNGAPCRLLDLHELLSDGGVGRSQHVLVGQGQIGTVLSARPDEHRAIIEEAAGVTKHRSRRNRAVRRLEQTEIDVARLTDILDEQRKRLRPLRRQANAAERHGMVRDEILALRRWLGGRHLRSLRDRRAAVTAEQERLRTEIETGSAELTELQQRLERLRGDASDVGRALERDTAAAARLETVAERFQRIALVARERRSSLESRQRGTGERRHDLELELADLGREIALAGETEVTAGDLGERREEVLRQLEDEERSLAEQIQLPAEGVIANLRGDLRSLEAAAERDQREREMLGHRSEVVTSRLETEQADAATLIDEIQRTDAEVGELQQRFDAAHEAGARARATLESAEAAQREAEVGVAAARARVEGLEAAIAGLGDPEAIRRAAAADGVVGALVARLDVPADVAVAVDGALGEWRDAFIISDREKLRAAAARLKGAGLGGVGFVVDRSTRTGAAVAVAAQWGVDALIDRLGPGADRALAGAVLGDVIIAEGWTAAWNIVERHPELRAVTPEGDLVTSTGMRLAQPDGAGPAALEAAGVELEARERDLARAESVLVTARRDAERTGREERAALERLESAEARLAGYTEALGLNERSRAAGEQEMERIQARASAIAEAAANRQERLVELRGRITGFEGEEQTRQRAWEALNRRRDEVARKRDEARRLREQVAAELAGARERRRLLETRRGVAERELRSLDEAPVDPAVVATLAGVEENARRAFDVVREHVVVLRGRQQRLRTEAGEADTLLAGARDRRGEVERAVNLAKERSSTISIELAEIAVRDEAALEALRRDADADEAAALSAPSPELDEGVDPEERLASLEAQLRRMGAINPLAAEEYRELHARVEVLDAQLADLDESRSQLRKVIRVLDDEMAELFKEAFDEIARYYEENFSLVFPGGRGRLRLTDPDRLLDAGVEIEAQPLGKKVGRLSLLSGGERSLAAVAFLFAVFRARPSPFYVLDEVEAALDDANLRRFLRLIDTLGRHAQVIIITHQQQTMEAGDILYGVTMEPGESSKVIARRLREPAI